MNNIAAAIAGRLCRRKSAGALSVTVLLPLGLVVLAALLSTRIAPAADAAGAMAIPAAGPARLPELGPATDVKILTPTGGTTVTAGSDSQINWQASGGGFNGIYLYFWNEEQDVTSTVYYPNAANPNCIPASASSNYWRVPALKQTRARLRIDLVEDCAVPNSVVASYTTGEFTIQGLKVWWIAPNGGETMLGGTPLLLNWGTDDDLADPKIDHVVLRYSTDGANYYFVPGANRTSANGNSQFGLDNSGSFSWTLPVSDVAAMRVSVEVCDASEFCQGSLGLAVSGPFRVTTDPNFKSITLLEPDGLDQNGEATVYFTGETQKVRWTSTGTLDDLYAYYSLDSGASFPDSQRVADCTGNTGVQEWTIPKLDSTAGRMRVVSRSNCAGSGTTIAEDVSSADFLIFQNRFNRRPRANAGANQTILEGNQVFLDASGSRDPDGDPLSYQWRQLRPIPEGMSVLITNANSAVASFIAPAVQQTQTLLFAVTVNDTPTYPGPSRSSVARVQVTIKPAPPSVSSIGPLCTNTGGFVNLLGANLAYGRLIFDGIPAVTFGGDNQLTAIVPNGAASGPLSLQGPGGTVALTQRFDLAPVELSNYALSQNIEGTQLIWRKDTLLQVFPSMGGAAPRAGCLASVDGGTVRIRPTGIPTATLIQGGANNPNNAVTVPLTPTLSRHLNESINFLLPAIALNFTPTAYVMLSLDVTLTSNGVPVLTNTIQITNQLFYDTRDNMRVLTVFMLPPNHTQAQLDALYDNWRSGVETFLRAWPLPNADTRIFLNPIALWEWTENRPIDLSVCTIGCDITRLGARLERTRLFANGLSGGLYNLPGGATHIQMIIDRSLIAPGTPSGAAWRPGFGNSVCQGIGAGCFERVSLVVAEPAPNTPETGATMGQEIGHNFNLVTDDRPNCCRNSNVHSRYNEAPPCTGQYSFAQAELDQFFTGPDGLARPVVGSRRSRSSLAEYAGNPSSFCAQPNARQPKSIMSYAPYQTDDNAFLEPTDYQFLFNALRTQVSIDPLAPARRPATTQDYFIEGAIGVNDSIEVYGSRLVPALGISLPVTFTSPYTLAFMSGNQTLAQYPIPVNFDRVHDGGAGQPGIFSVVRPFPAATQRIELRHGSNALKSILVSANAPTVSVLSPAGGESFTAGQHTTVHWTAGDADGDALTYDVFFSSDGGATYSPLQVGLPMTQTTISWDTSLTPATAQGQIRVDASDGVRVSTATSGLFSIANHPPHVSIASPLDGAVFHAGELVSLRGAAHTAEDAAIPDDHLVWESSLNGPLGSGALLHTHDLLTGTHFLTLTAISGVHGLSASATISLTIVPVEQSANMAVTIHGPATAYPGDLVTYTVTYTNHGNLPASHARVKVRFPWLPDSSSGPGAPTRGEDEYSADSILEWDLGDVAPFTGGTLVVSARVPLETAGATGGRVTVEVLHRAPELDDSDDTAAATTHVNVRLYLPVIRR